MRKGVDCKGQEWEEVSVSVYMKDITNFRSGRLCALLPVLCNGKKQWLCRCDCGNYIVAPCNHLTSNNTRSCGCLHSDIMKNRWSDYRDVSRMIGKKFGRLTVREFLRVEDQEAIYRFDCDCGNVLECRMHSVKGGNTRSCGCLKEDFLAAYEMDIIGQQFGRLLVTRCVGVSNRGEHEYECLCDCGDMTVAPRSGLIRGLIKSCGCLRSVGENNIKQILTSSNIKFKQQKAFPDLISNLGGHPTYDFAILDESDNVVRLIEFDGPQHDKPYDYFGGEEKFLKVRANDILKNEYAISHNIPLVRIPYVKKDTMNVDDLLGDTYLITTIVDDHYICGTNNIFKGET